MDSSYATFDFIVDLYGKEPNAAEGTTYLMFRKIFLSFVDSNALFRFGINV